MKSERKIDSSETIIVSSENGKGSKVDAPLVFKFNDSQTANHTRCTMMNHILPACVAMASPIRADSDRRARAFFSSSQILVILRSVGEAVCITQCYLLAVVSASR